MHEIVFTVPLFCSDDEVEITIEFKVTSWGSADSWMEPGDPIEWEIERIWMDSAEVLYDSDLFRKGALFQVLAEAGDTYIGENYDFNGNSPDPYED